MVMHRRVSVVAVLACLGSIAAPRAQTADSYAAMRFRYIGPVGNRLIAVAGVPRDPNVYYAGAASGGIFKTTDSGAHWDAIFDGQAVSSIGSLAVAPSDANVVWAGTCSSSRTLVLLWTPWWRGSRPVRIEACAGSVSGAGENACA